MMDNRLELRLLSGPQAFRVVFEAGSKRIGTPIVDTETWNVIAVCGAKFFHGERLRPPALGWICSFDGSKNGLARQPR